MPNYLITYTIKDDDVRSSINDFLHAQGFTNEVDQSTRFGLSPQSKTELESLLKVAREEYCLDKTDTMLLFYASLNKRKESSVFMVNII